MGVTRWISKGSTYYQVFVGPGALFDGEEGPILDDITDGKSNTAMVVEARKPVPWTKTEDVPFDDGELLPKLGGQFDEGFHVVFADGSAWLLSKPIDESYLHDLITPRRQKSLSKDRTKSTNLPKSKG